MVNQYVVPSASPVKVVVEAGALTTRGVCAVLPMYGVTV